MWALWVASGTQGPPSAARDAPRWLLLCGPLSKHPACLERPPLPGLPCEPFSGPLHHPCSTFPDDPGLHWTLLCAPRQAVRNSNSCFHSASGGHGGKRTCWKLGSSSLFGGLNEIICKWCLAQGLACGTGLITGRSTAGFSSCLTMLRWSLDAGQGPCVTLFPAPAPASVPSTW